LYKVTRRIIILDNKIHIGYGIKCKKYRFDNISCDREKIVKLCTLCNELDLAEIHLGNVVEDFLYDFEVN